LYAENRAVVVEQEKQRLTRKAYRGYRCGRQKHVAVVAVDTVWTCRTVVVEKKRRGRGRKERQRREGERTDVAKNQRKKKEMEKKEIEKFKRKT